ncbi:MAG TPA: AMP-binding protein [Steroidobacteraceae bacterium]|nr:AMP-binding protein [Steroidobacteraceae bacterium]
MKHADSSPESRPQTEVAAGATLVSIFHESCARFGDRPAYHNLGVTLRFADLERLSGQLAAYFLDVGLAPGERVALMMPNVLQYPVALFAALRAGLTVVNTNPLYTPRELRHQLIDSGASAIVILENFAHVLAQVIGDTSVRQVIVTGAADLASLPKRTAVNFLLRHVRHMVPRFDLPQAVSLRQALARGAAVRFEPPAVRPDGLAFLQYTGGTTGTPKGAMLTHGNMVANLTQIRMFWGGVIESGREVMITPLPLYHVFCLTCNCLLFLDQGGLNVLITNPRDIPGLVRELARWPFSMITGVNTLYAALLAQPDFARLDFSHLKLGAAGGAALHPSVEEQWRRITGRPLLEGYGLTEASPVIACNPPDQPRIGTVGLALPGTEISIREGDVELAAGEAGELWVRGPQVMRGYWKRPQETADVLTADGWLRTGDVAVLEPSGYLRIVDRKKDLINVSGFKVFPNEVESVVTEHSAVLECGCIGLPDVRSGQAVKIFVVLRPGARVTPEELIEHCRTRLTPYKVPRHVEFRQSLPKTQIGKILRRELEQERTGRAA